MNDLKKYSKPFMVAEKFVANSYIGSCPPYVVGQVYRAKQLGEGAFVPNFFGVRDVNNDELWTQDDITYGGSLTGNNNIPGPEEEIVYIGNGWATGKNTKPQQFNIETDVVEPGYVMLFARPGEDYTYGTVHGVYAGDVTDIMDKNVS